MTLEPENAEKPLKPQVPDFCPSCDTADLPFRPVLRMVTQEFRGGTFEVEAPAMRCSHCGFEIAASGHLNALCKATREAYDKGVLNHAPEDLCVIQAPDPTNKATPTKQTELVEED